MKINIEKIGYQFVCMLIIGMLILLGQKIGMGISIVKASLGMCMLIVAAMLAIILKELFPKSIFPAFGWATIIGLILSMPYSPTSKIFTENINNVNFMAITTPLLSFAGISVGSKIKELKAMSWKIVLVSFIVFTMIFFACALISELVLTLQGKI